MCHCVCCDCWWANCCGVCAGWHLAYLLCSCWCCKPQELMAFDPYVCHCCDCDGYGGNFFCYGSLLCAPPSVKNWSKFLAMRQLNPNAIAVPPGSARLMVVNNPNNVYIRWYETIHLFPFIPVIFIFIFMTEYCGNLSSNKSSSHFLFSTQYTHQHKCL